ncbi:MAG: carbonic anhydrase [Rhizomicrobium sp.]
MCDEHPKSAGPSRRDFAGLAASAAALTLIPMRSWAADVKLDALCVMCIDYRLVDRAVKFFDSNVGPEKYDLVALAGASLAAVGPAFPASNAAFWSHIDIAKSLHNIQKVVILDHRECGAYKVQYGTLYAGNGAPEYEQHREIMKLVQGEFERRKVGLPCEFWLMPVAPGEPVPVPLLPEKK